MRPRPALIIPPIFLIVSILILIFAPSGSLLYLIPIFVGPIGGVASILGLVMATQQLPSLRKDYILILESTRFSRSFLEVIGGFLMLVLAFAISYSAANNFHGAIIASNCDNQATNFFTLWYFSMVTGSTVGYGDFTPEGSARLVAFIQLFLFWVLLSSAAIHFHTYIGLLSAPSAKYKFGSWPELR